MKRTWYAPTYKIRATSTHKLFPGLQTLSWTIGLSRGKRHYASGQFIYRSNGLYGKPSTRSTIEVAHFLYNAFWMTGFLDPKSSECLSSSEKWWICIRGPCKFSPGCNLIFAEVNVRVGYGAPRLRSLRKNRVDLYRRTPPSQPPNHDEQIENRGVLRWRFTNNVLRLLPWEVLYFTQQLTSAKI